MKCSWIAVVVLLSGCATTQSVSPTVYQQPSAKAEHTIERSYELGVPLEVFVGERMLRVQDFHVVAQESGASSTRLMATEQFTLKVPPFMSVTVTPQELIVVTGTTQRDGKTYRVVALPAATTSALRFLISDEGAFEGSALNVAGSRMGWSYTPNPQSVRLVPAPSQTRVDATKGALNFELVYSGTSRDSFQLLYREYTPSDLARPAFSQTLVYERGSGTIRFRNLQLEVHEATNEKIRFTVLSDNDGSRSGIAQ